MYKIDVSRTDSRTLCENTSFETVLPQLSLSNWYPIIKKTRNLNVLLRRRCFVNLRTISPQKYAGTKLKQALKAETETQTISKHKHTNTQTHTYSHQIRIHTSHKRFSRSIAYLNHINAVRCIVAYFTCSLYENGYGI